jgi:hypothetical protein
MPLKLGYPYEWMTTNLPGNLGKAEADPNHLMRLPQ